MRSLNPTAAGTPVSVGVIPSGNELGWSLALCEILAAGTLAEDASSPPPVPVRPLDAGDHVPERAEQGQIGGQAGKIEAG